jgi:hypothetical protein
MCRWHRNHPRRKPTYFFSLAIFFLVSKKIGAGASFSVLDEKVLISRMYRRCDTEYLISRRDFFKKNTCIPSVLLMVSD